MYVYVTFAWLVSIALSSLPATKPQHESTTWPSGPTGRACLRPVDAPRAGAVGWSIPCSRTVIWSDCSNDTTSSRRNCTELESARQSAHRMVPGTRSTGRRNGRPAESDGRASASSCGGTSFWNGHRSPGNTRATVATSWRASDNPDFPERGLERLERIESEIAAAAESRDRLLSDVKQLREQLKRNVTGNPRLLAGTMQGFVEQRGWLVDCRTRCAAASRSTIRRRRPVPARPLERLGPDWNPERIKALDLSPAGWQRLSGTAQSLRRGASAPAGAPSVNVVDWRPAAASCATRWPNACTISMANRSKRR